MGGIVSKIHLNLLTNLRAKIRDKAYFCCCGYAGAVFQMSNVVMISTIGKEQGPFERPRTASCNLVVADFGTKIAFAKRRLGSDPFKIDVCLGEKSGHGLWFKFLRAFFFKAFLGLAQATFRSHVVWDAFLLDLIWADCV